MGDKMGDNLQISKLKIKNLQNGRIFKCLKLSNFRFIIADSMLFFAKNHFPTQNLLSDAESNICKYNAVIINNITLF